jgi:UDP-galactopyranose mutase
LTNPLPRHDHHAQVRRGAHYVVVGAGFSGAVLARELVEHLPDCRVHVIEARPHVAGNCHTERDPRTGVMVHRYGPHIFNTNSARAWDYINRFATMRPYLNRVKASTSRGIFSFPINLHTINQFFGQRLDPDQARAFLSKLGDTSIGEPHNFEQQALKTIGRDLYETFFRGYTRKAWGCEPAELPASVLKRLPVRFTYDDSYYDAIWQGIPAEGYTAAVQKILDHPSIKVALNTRFEPAIASDADHVFYTGPIDAYFSQAQGALGYRTVEFERIDFAGADYQGNAVINYPELDPPWLRIHEHKHFAPWEKHERTVAFREYSRETAAGDTPYYPKRRAADVQMLGNYRGAATRLPNISFLGRLGTYRYLDMDDVIDEALDFSAAFIRSRRDDTPAPVFPNLETR